MSVFFFAEPAATEICTLSLHDALPISIAEAVAGFFDETKNRKLLERLEKLGLNFTEPTVTEGKGPLAGQTYVVTGTLPSLSRAKAAELIEAAGGHVADSVSKKTTALVLG